MKTSKSSYYPVFLNVSGKNCLVIGGGAVALRKVKTLVEKGASVEVISPDICPELDSLSCAGKISVQKKLYETGDLDRAFMVIAATDDPCTNLEIVKDARDLGVLINVVDDPHNSDFIVPSCVQRGDITVAISTSGRSPALARKIRTKLENLFGEEYASLALLIDDVRSELKNQHIKIDSEDWQEALDIDALIEMIRKGEDNKAKDFILSRLRTQQSVT